jgi:hypothetical protein
MKAPIQSKLRTILSLYSPNQNESSSTIPNESFSSSYYARTIPNDDSSLNKSSCSIRGGFTRQKEWNDFVTKVNDTKRGDVYQRLINARFNRSANTCSKGNKKIKKKISTITDNYILADPLIIRDSTKNNNNNNQDEKKENDKPLLRNSLSLKTSPKKEERKENYFNDFSNAFKERKPIKRFYISDLSAIEGNFGKKKIEWKIKKAQVLQLSKEEQQKLNENNDMNAYGTFVTIKPDNTVKNVKYALKPF